MAGRRQGPLSEPDGPSGRYRLAMSRPARRLIAVAVLAGLATLIALPVAARVDHGRSAAQGEEGVADGREASPRQRLAFAVKRRARAGDRIALRVRRRAATGRYEARICTAPPVAGWGCRTLRFRPGVKRVTRDLRVRAPGRWLFQLRNGKQRLRRTTLVRPRGGKLSVLATGDSMIQIVDHFLADRLGKRAAVRSEAHVSTGISKPSLLDWVANARRQARRVRPQATVVFLGANDGFPMSAPSGGTADCCGGAWVAEYARRAARMMRAYRRGGAGRVFWLTLPAPRSSSFRGVYGPVNEAIRRAAKRVDGVEVVPLARIFTPGFRYRDTYVVKGRPVRVRQGDGIHLNTTGASIAAGKVVAAMRARRVL